MPVRPNIAAMAGYAPGEQPRGGGFIKLNTNESPYPPSPKVFEAVREALTGDRLRKYPEPLGDTFREAAGRALGVQPDQVLIGNGSDDILTILTRTFVPEGGLIAAPTPSYILYKSLAEIQGARFQTVPFTSDWYLPVPWPAERPDLLFVPNPNSPTGTFMDPIAIYQASKHLGCPVVCDEAYADFAPKRGLRYTIEPNFIVTRTLSKSYALAGIRFGFAVAHPDLIRELVKVKDSYNCDVLSLAAATAAILDQDYLAEARAKIIATRERLTHALRDLGFAVLPSEANFVWAQRSDRPVKPLYEGLKERRILVRYMNYPGYGDGLRVSVGTDAEVDRFLSELNSLLQ
ncbi:MAG TPA: histidinol-phosphate transaminase [Gemmataceae bacterium]|nr:histidinol-phosphate transaminase [Gemmataceae bacterium]